MQGWTEGAGLVPKLIRLAPEGNAFSYRIAWAPKRVGRRETEGTTARRQVGSPFGTAGLGFDKLAETCFARS